MPRGRPVPPIQLTGAERRTLQRWSRREHDASARLALRARIILLASLPTAMPGTSIAARLRIPTQTVSRWRRRFVAGRLAALHHGREAGTPQFERHGTQILPRWTPKTGH